MPMIKSHHLSHVHASLLSDALSSKSSNTTKKYHVEKEDRFPQLFQTKAKDWMFKSLSDVRESCCEAACGELYRYFIGGAQPKTRTLENGNVASEFVAFQSATDFFLNKLTPDEKDQFRFDFRNDLSGFVNLLVGSIFLEENDLHDGNFGVDTKTGKFIKIDHGQSLNQNRTHRPFFEKGSSLKKQFRDNIVRLSRVKFWSKEAAISFFKKHHNPNQMNLHRKTDRQDFGSGFSSRTYQIKPELIEGLFKNYFEDRYNISSIRQLGYTASASPLFDQRFAVFGLLQPSDLEILEQYKYQAIAKIIFTPDDFYTHIIQNAAEFPEDGKLLAEIQNTILARKQELSSAVMHDKKFLDFLSSEANMADVQEQIHESIIRMQSNKSGMVSKRYGAYSFKESSTPHSPP